MSTTNKIAFDLAVAYASSVYADELARGSFKPGGLAPDDIERMEHFRDLVEDAYEYYQLCIFDFGDLADA